MRELETKLKSMSKKERLKTLAQAFLNEMQNSDSLPLMFRAMFPTCQSLVQSSVDKMTEEQAEEMIAKCRDILTLLE